MPNYQKKQVIADPDIGNGGMETSKAQPQGGGQMASAEELARALEASQRRVAELEAAAAKPRSDIQELAAAIAQMAQPQPTVVPDTDNINRSSDFKNQRATIDGRSLMEAQETLMEYRNEEKLPIAIPKSFVNTVGANLAITVNGVRVSIPCDGKTHYINKTHWEHAKERLAKIDLLNANNEPNMVVVDA